MIGDLEQTNSIDSGEFYSKPVDTKNAVPVLRSSIKLRSKTPDKAFVPEPPFQRQLWTGSGLYQGVCVEALYKSSSPPSWQIMFF